MHNEENFSSFACALEFIISHTYFFPEPNYLNCIQNDVNFTESVRRTIIHALLELGNAYEFPPSTCVLAITYLERFLSCEPVQLANLQLFASACFLIAAKVDEATCGYKCRLEDLAQLAGNSFEPLQLIEAERIILNALDHRLLNVSLITLVDVLLGSIASTSTILEFKLSITDHQELLLSNLCYFLIELSISEYNILAWHPCSVCISCIYVSCRILEMEEVEFIIKDCFDYLMAFIDVDFNPDVLLLNGHVYNLFLRSKSKGMVPNFLKDPVPGTVHEKDTQKGCRLM
ncbi:hypothetical protein P9112_012130 [Eukaryota sp. TZLM1-RC]